MSDVWERIYVLDVTAADRDEDHDGWTNQQESALGTDPRDAQSTFYLAIQPGDDPNTFKLPIDTAFGKLYRIESSTDLAHWSTLGSLITGTGAVVDIPIPHPTDPIFYRGSVAGDIDEDGDGLTAWEEKQLGTSDSNPDSDADGMPDSWEFTYRLDPTRNDADADPDGDGISNLQEYQAGSNPTGFLAAVPENLDFAVNLPGTQSQSVLLRNTGPASLDYVCETDAVSYEFKDSNSTNGPVYQWDDISATGTLLSVVSQADDDFEAFDLAFSFPFFGQSYTTIYVSSNGYITVGSGSSRARPGSFPGDRAVPGEIAAFHTDLDPSAGGRILYLNAPGHTVIQFEQVPHYDGSGPVTFQIILDQTGAITFQYKSMMGTLNAASVGLQNLTRDQGVEVAFRKPYVADGLAVRLVRDNSWLQLSPANGQIEPGQAVEVTVMADGSRLTDGNYTGLLRARSVADQSALELPVTLIANAPPAVELVAPVANLGVVAAENVSIEAEAQDRRGQVVQVDFFEGSTLIGATTEPPFAIVWQPPHGGSFVLTARATDDQGATALSVPRVLNVEEDSDADGLGDSWEMANFDNLSETAAGDFDGDGLSNLQEFHDHSAGNDFYEGGIPYPGMLNKTRGAFKSKVGFQPFVPTQPSRYFLKSEMVLDLVGGNPESPVSGTVEITTDPNTGRTATTTTGNAPPPYYGVMEWDTAPTATRRVDRLTILFSTEADGGAYDDPPNLVDDWQATLVETTTLSQEFTTDQLIALARAALKPIPPFDAPFSFDDDATFADFEFPLGGEEVVYISHSKYQFKWHRSPNLLERKSITWIEAFYPFEDPRTAGKEDTSPIKTVRHWEGTGTETDVYYLTPDRPGRYEIQILLGELMVDGNRDGEMSVSDGGIHNKDLTSQDRPYRFWVNDDDDTELTYGEGGQTSPAETEKVPASRPDYSQHKIVSKRNLEDFSRLWINLTGIADQVESGEIQIGLRWKTVTSDAPAISIYPSEDSEGSTKYLTEEAVAGRQIAGNFNTATSDQSGKQTIDPSSGVFRFKPDYWNGLSSQNAKKCLLFEGAQEGKGEITIVLFDRNGDELTEGGSVWLELKDIKKMYQRATATPDPLDPLPYRSAGSTFDESEISYTPDVTPRFEQPADEEPLCLVFVHGWRLTYDDSITFTETMFKRLWWQGYKGRFAAFRWATQTSSFSYNTSEWFAWKYGRSLANYVENYVKHQLPDYTINLAAHSMGNIVTASALKRGMSLNKYFLMQAAIPAGCFNDAVNNYPPFLNAEQTNPTPDTEQDLGYRLYSNGANVRKFVSFFNIDDYALATGTTRVLGWPFETNWEKNQVDYKPNRFNEFDSTAGDYLYSVGQPVGQRVTVNWNPTFSGTYLTSRPVTDIHESMAFVARPRSKAAGAEIHNATVFGSVLDLRAGCNFTSDVLDHSGQFERSIQSLGAFYTRLVDELQR